MRAVSDASLSHCLRSGGYRARCRALLFVTGLLAAAIAAQAADHAIVVAAETGLEPALVSAVTNHLARQTQLPVRLAEPLPTEQSHAERITWLEKAVGKDAFCGLALVNTPTSEEAHRLVALPERRLALLNIAFLRLAETGEASAKLLRARVLKQSLAAVGLAAGMPPCPFPRCCLQHSTTYGELDLKGVTFCPPCHGRFETLRDKAVGDGE